MDKASDRQKKINALLMEFTRTTPEKANKVGDLLHKIIYHNNTDIAKCNAEIRRCAKLLRR